MDEPPLSLLLRATGDPVVSWTSEVLRVGLGPRGHSPREHSSRWIPIHRCTLFQDEKEALIGALRNEAKAAGIPDTPEAGLEFLISRIKNNLHIALCFSPVGDIFRIRKKFLSLSSLWKNMEIFHQKTMFLSHANVMCHITQPIAQSPTIRRSF